MIQIDQERRKEDTQSRREEEVRRKKSAGIRRKKSAERERKNTASKTLTVVSNVSVSADHRFCRDAASRGVQLLWHSTNSKGSHSKQTPHCTFSPENTHCAV